jgi:Ecdysteroid kinase-like family
MSKSFRSNPKSKIAKIRSIRFKKKKKKLYLTCSLMMNVYKLIYFLHGWLAEWLCRLRRVVLGYVPFLCAWLPSLFAVRAGDTSINVAWLTDVLRASNVLAGDGHVDSVALQNLGENRGLAGDMCKLSIRYAVDGSDGPETLVLKRSRGGAQSRMNCIHSSMWREAKFYEALRDGEISRVLPTVKAHFAHHSALLGEYTVLMDDVFAECNGDGDGEQRRVVGVNMVTGNQIWGVPIDTFWRQTPVDAVEMMFDAAADMHAAHWRDPALLQSTWLKGADWYRGEHRARWQAGLERARSSWRTVTAKLDAGDQFKSFAMDAQLSAVVSETLERASWSRMRKALANTERYPFTLCHGDFHSANAFLKLAGGSDGDDALVFVDWSEAGVWTPACDLAQHIISDVPAQLFAEHWERLVERYVDRLASAGAQYPLDDAKQDFLHGGAERWIWIFAVMSSFPLPEVALQYFHDQLLAFIKLDSHAPSSYVLKSLISLL